jgi:hypothetical protein
MLSVTIAGKGKGKKAVALAKAKRGEPLWNASKIEKDYWFS